MSDNIKKVKYFIKQASAGEIGPVLNSLCEILDGLDPSDEGIQELIKNYCEDHLSLFTVNGEKFVISQAGYIDGYYIDQKHNQKVVANFLEGSCTTEPMDPSVQLEQNVADLRNSLEKELHSYMEQNYRQTFLGFDTLLKKPLDKENNLGCYVLAQYQDFSKLSLYVVLTSKHFNFGNHCGGEWISEWKISNNQVEGKIRVNAHYYEDGNIMFKDIKSTTQNVDLKGDNEDCNRIMKIIKQTEEDVLNGFKSLFEQWPNQLKNMRRNLPITRQKINWQELYYKKQQ